jgi:hypothetical protein
MLRLALPPRNLAQYHGDPLTGGSARVQPHVKGDEVGICGPKPVEKRDQLAQRPGEVAQAGGHQR